MASIIRIKRSETAGNPSTLGAGELAYSALTDNGSNGGDRLYIGIGTETSGDAANHYVIGGKFFTDRLDHTAGTLTASSAIVVDASSKIDELNVDNITLNGNTISTTDTNGNLTLSPDGTGLVDIAGGYTLPRADGSNGQALITDGSGTVSFSTISTAIDIEGDSGTDTVSLLTDTLTFTGGEGIDTAVTDNTITISAEDASDTNKGVATFNTASFTVSSGDVTIKSGGVSNAQLANSTISIAADSGSTDPVSLGETLTISGDTGITTTVGTNSVSIDLDDTAVTAGSYGSSTEIPTFTVDQQGRLTAAGTASISTTLDIAADSGTDDGVALGTDTLTISGGTNINTSVSGDTITVNLDTDIGSLTSLDVDNITIDGNTISSTDTNGNIVLDPDGTGTVDVNSSRITNVTDPSGDQDAATKAYVDSVANGLDVKESCSVATTANLTATYDNGAGTLTASSNGAILVDGVNPSVSDRVLVKDQTDPVENGIYVVTTVGDGTTAFVLTRAPDADTAAELTGGTFFFVEQGTANADNGYVATHNGTPTFGTTDITFAQFSGAGQISAGDALSKTGNQLNVEVDDSSIEVSSDALQVKALGITNAMLAGSIANAKLTNSSVTINSNSLSLGGSLTLVTDDIQEDGSPTNLWYTDARSRSAISVSAGTGLSYNNSTGVLAGVDATTSTKGVASFSSDNFSVSSGAVSIAEIDGGTYS